MPAGIWRITKVHVGDVPGGANLTCLETQQPVTYTLRENTSGEINTVSACVTNGVGLCDEGGLQKIIEDSGYTLDTTMCP